MMKFLKENLFLVILAAVLVAAAATWVAVNRSLASTIRQRSDERRRLSDQLATLQRLGINQKKVDQALERVKVLRAYREATEVQCLSWNRRDYSILTFKIGGRTVSAYPVDPNVGRDTLSLLYGRGYIAAAQAMLRELDPTQPPTSDMLKEAAAVRSESPAASERPARGGGLLDRTGLLSAGRTPAPIEPTRTAVERAVADLVLKRAMNGRIYADGNSVFVPVTVDTRSREDLQWMAQISLWVQRDIVSAIGQTIKDASANEDKGGGVPTSAVKRLKGINVRGYAVRRGAAFEGGRGAAATGGEGLQYVGLGGAVGGTALPMLTGRATNQLYDVVHYDFTVIMPTEHLLSLYRNLMAKNYHTILDVRIDNVAQVRTGTAATSENKEGGYYYGTEPVVEASITGEMLLLADWTRGRIDPETGQFDKDYPALMPTEFLRLIQSSDAGALRPEDRNRLERPDSFSGVLAPGARSGGGGRDGRYDAGGGARD